MSMKLLNSHRAPGELLWSNNKEEFSLPRLNALEVPLFRYYIMSRLIIVTHEREANFCVLCFHLPTSNSHKLSILRWIFSLFCLLHDARTLEMFRENSHRIYCVNQLIH